MFISCCLNLAEHGCRTADICFKWSDCTRRKKVGQYHKNCATVEYAAADWVG